MSSTAARVVLRLPLGLPLGLLVGLLLVALAVGGCSSDDSSSNTPASVAPTPLAQLNTASLRIARINFCGLLPHTAIEDALGGREASHESYRNGDDAQLTQDVKDVAHEFGCSYTAKDGTQAQAWVFAQPVDRELARKINRQAKHRKGCTAESGAGFGQSSVRQVCSLDGGIQRVRLSGLFHNSWLACEISAPEAAAPVKELRARADAWCVQVANITNTERTIG